MKKFLAIYHTPKEAMAWMQDASPEDQKARHAEMDGLERGPRSLQSLILGLPWLHEATSELALRT